MKASVCIAVFGFVFTFAPSVLGNRCEDGNILCKWWASIGECKRNPNYMMPYCRKSCNQCNNEIVSKCPEIQCPNDSEILDECRKAEFIIGGDGQTRCRVCDSNLCGQPSYVCPQLMCPEEDDIPEYCNKPNFLIGQDGITKCRMCDTSVCGSYAEVCPQIQCPYDFFIPDYCRRKQNSIGMDGITICPMCDINICQ